MKQEPFVIERTYNARVEKVWDALTNNEKMKQWYFQIKEFKPEPDFEFQFEGKNEGKTFIHLCKITEVVPMRKLAYSWTYKDTEGYSVVTFELFPEGSKTRLKLTHEGLETFPATKDYAKENFVQGWTHIAGKSLKEFLEKE